ncbi:hypothetical protein GCM10025867_16800 [Frondihabitans sucicola]|uniref:Uncharacterized protein n=1 Tax=Frondihabitans sucicola TaxID=1268041 RepID=A0ABN6XWN7_9MICO|nr:hypothetical protein GCM10025867_16800 [Frondihabitans sucicola]
MTASSGAGYGMAPASERIEWTHSAYPRPTLAAWASVSATTASTDTTTYGSLMRPGRKSARYSATDSTTNDGAT